MYTHLFFDLDRTLWDMETNHRICFESLFAHFQLQERLSCLFPTYYDQYMQINRSLWEEYQKGKITKEHLDVQRFSLTFDAFCVPPPHRPSIDQMRHFAQETMSKQTQLMPFAIETLSYLKTKGYEMSIVSNGFVESQYEKLRHSGLAPFFRHVFLSEEVGFPKPQKRFFDHALRITKATPTQAVVIGDDYVADIEGAAKAGIDQIYVQPHRTAKTKAATYQIASLQELRSIL